MGPARTRPRDIEFRIGTLALGHMRTTPNGIQSCCGQGAVLCTSAWNGALPARAGPLDGCHPTKPRRVVPQRDRHASGAATCHTHARLPTAAGWAAHHAPVGEELGAEHHLRSIGTRRRVCCAMHRLTCHPCRGATCAAPCHHQRCEPHLVCNTLGSKHDHHRPYRVHEPGKACMWRTSGRLTMALQSYATYRRRPRATACTVAPLHANRCVTAHEGAQRTKFGCRTPMHPGGHHLASLQGIR